MQGLEDVMALLHLEYNTLGKQSRIRILSFRSFRTYPYIVV